MENKFFRLFFLTVVISLLYETVICQKLTLSENIKPERYELVINTQLAPTNSHFWGDVRITVMCFLETSQIILHKTNLEIQKDDVWVKPAVPDGSESSVGIKINQLYESENDRYIIELANNLEKDKSYEIHISYKAVLSSEPFGYFVVVNERGGTERTTPLAITQLEPDGARRLFPCFDQLNMKAKFKISLGHSGNLVALSNMKRLETKTISDKDNWVLDEFEESDPLSPSAVAIALINFKSIELVDSVTTIPVRVWADAKVLEYMHYVLTKAPAVIQFYSKYFDYPCSLKKFDILALEKLDGEFIESYGLMTVRESLILYPNPEFEVNIFDISLNICNLISCQWISTSVTMTSCNEYWLHRALSIFLEKLCQEEVFTEEKSSFFDFREVTTFIQVLNDDMYSTTSKPIMDSTDNLNWIDGTVDQFKTAKAYHLIRMIYFLLDEGVFRKSLINYLSRYKFKNSNIDEVWDVFTETLTEIGISLNGMTMKEIMDSWITKRAYPLLTVSRDDSTKSVTIKQERFVLYEDENASSTPTVKWKIPLRYITETNFNIDYVEVRNWLVESEMVVHVENLNDTDWILFNWRLSVLCRINYDQKNWSLLQRTLLDENTFSKIDAKTRAHLLSDMFVLSRAGKLPYPTLFDTVKYLSHESSHFSWWVAEGEFYRILLDLMGTEYFEPYKNYVKAILTPVFANIQFMNSGNLQQNKHLKEEFITAIFQALCSFEVDNYQNLSQKLFKDWLNPDKPEQKKLIPMSIREIIDCQSMKLAKSYEWISLHQKYLDENDRHKKIAILEALGCSENPIILKNYLEWSISFHCTIKIDSLKIFESLSSNKMGYQLMKQFFKTNFLKICKYHDNDSSRIVFYLKTLLKITKKREDLNELSELMKSKREKFKNSEIHLEGSITIAERNILFLENNEAVFSQYFLK